MHRLQRILEKRFAEAGMTVRRLAGHVKTLSDLFRDSGAAARYMDRKEFRLAYLFYFYPLNVFKYLALFEFYREQITAAGSFFDYGCGPLTCHTALALSGIPLEELYAWDRNRSVFEEGRLILRELDPETAGRIRFSMPGGPVGFVSAGNLFTELELSRRREEVRILADYVGSKGSLLILEPGTRISFAGLVELKPDLAGLGFRLLSPCPSLECPMAGKDWCHENILFPRSSLMEEIEEITGLDNRFVNFSYLLMGRSPVPSVFPPDSLKAVSNLLDRKGEYVMYFCGNDGIRQFRLLKRNLSPANHEFTGLRRGDIAIVERFLTRSHFSDVGKDTDVRLVRKFGRN